MEVARKSSKDKGSSYKYANTFFTKYLEVVQLEKARRKLDVYEFEEL